MTFQEFVHLIFTPISYFVNWLKLVADSLFDNYIFIFFLCLTMILSFLWLVVNFIDYFFKSKIDNIEYENDRNKKYQLYKKIQYNYLNKHRNDEFDYIYNLTILRQQVLNGIYQKNPDLLFSNKILNYKLNTSALKEINKQYLSDNDPKNDKDIYYLVPNRVNKYNNKNVHIPSWLYDNDLTNKPLTSDEQKELQDLLDNF